MLIIRFDVLSLHTSFITKQENFHWKVIICNKQVGIYSLPFIRNHTPETYGRSGIRPVLIPELLQSKLPLELAMLEEHILR